MAKRSEFSLADVAVRPVRDTTERAQWDRLMDEHHYLGFRGMFGVSLRHVAETPDGRWLALIGWCADAFKVGARDRWIGWAPEQQFRRLRLIANNIRFLILPQARLPIWPRVRCHCCCTGCRATCSRATASRYSHRVLLAETFVDPLRFAGACYRASNWLELGETRGYARTAGGWVAHGEPKRIWVCPLTGNTRAELQRPDDRQVLTACTKPQRRRTVACRPSRSGCG